MKNAGDVIVKPRVYKAAEENPAIGIRQPIVVVVGRGEAANLKTSVKVQEPLIAPLPANKSVGELTVTTQAGEAIAKVPLYPLKAVEEGGIWTRMVDSVSLWF